MALPGRNLCTAVIFLPMLGCSSAEPKNPVWALMLAPAVAANRAAVGAADSVRSPDPEIVGPADVSRISPQTIDASAIAFRNAGWTVVENRGRIGFSNAGFSQSCSMSDKTCRPAEQALHWNIALSIGTSVTASFEGRNIPVSAPNNLWPVYAAPLNDRLLVVWGIRQAHGSVIGWINPQSGAMTTATPRFDGFVWRCSVDDAARRAVLTAPDGVIVLDTRSGETVLELRRPDFSPFHRSDFFQDAQISRDGLSLALQVDMRLYLYPLPPIPRQGETL